MKYQNSLNIPKIVYRRFGVKQKKTKTENYTNKSQEIRDFSVKKIVEYLGLKIINLFDYIKRLSKLNYFYNNRTLLTVRENTRSFLLLIKSFFLTDNLVKSYSAKPIKIYQFFALKIVAVCISHLNKIGSKPITQELHDFCFNILHHNERSCILGYLQSTFNIKVNLVNKIIVSLRGALRTSGIKITVLGKMKSPYSTWSKMKRKKVKLKELSDILGFRIIVNTKNECYRILDVIHHVYKIVPNNFRDYIESPKINGYQSIHTVIIGPSEQKIEIQIRTKEMQNEAKNGICAHRKY